MLVGLMVEVVVKRNGGRAMVYVLYEKTNVYGGRPVKDVFPSIVRIGKLYKKRLMVI